MVLIGTTALRSIVARCSAPLWPCVTTKHRLFLAEDGGYTLLAGRADQTLFDNMPWSTAEVAAETRRRIARLGWHLCDFPSLYDIDEPQDLAKLPAPIRSDLSGSTYGARHEAPISRRPA